MKEQLIRTTDRGLVLNYSHDVIGNSHNLLLPSVPGNFTDEKVWLGDLPQIE